MEKVFRGSCTAMLVGKDATIDGSTMIARDNDAHGSIEPQRFIVIKPEDQKKNYKSVITGLELELPDNPMKYTLTPRSILTEGIWGASGINSDNVAMSATETITTNSRILGVDPYNMAGIGEEDLEVIVLPYIHSAREGVERLGSLLEKYGTYEPNGISFADKDEIWWLETIAGHNWAAIKIPDDAYVVAPNRMNIDDFDFDSEDTLCSTGLRELIDEYHLNPDKDGTNLRHIFGSSTIRDSEYNNPRAWYIQKCFNPEIEQDPRDQDLPFICHSNKKLSIEDIKFALGTHYENTPYDAYGLMGTDEEKKMFRPVGINRNHSLHILQIRNNVPESIAGIHWLAFGVNTFNTIVPFYANVNDTPPVYRDTPTVFNPNSIYWLSRAMGLLGDNNYDLYQDSRNTFELEAVAKFRNIQIETDKGIGSQDNIADYLTAANDKIATEAMNRTITLFGNMIELGSPEMKLHFDLKG
ncbi:C69 family dipeptidase [Companilactobacillus allii]|uniref:Dipeptidase n=1 Tax=Companilactobacillus allii TaxID=1847728 RepID=A0A1P8Q2Z4_9LACO|nr:C69 family dipeptidase [Companilactobacillus allii]APX72187.1 dipeptidase [Companilactobacillus allii]USQ69286.1 C69 family dipeptidase [Companilactobacillus allii]